MFKTNSGFTLVELIVVIAILAILATIAIPSYGGYVEKAETQADTATANMIKTAVLAAYAEEGETVTAIEIKNGAVTGLSGDAEANFKVYYPDEIPSDLNATWNGSEWKFD